MSWMVWLGVGLAGVLMLLLGLMVGFMRGYEAGWTEAWNARAGKECECDGKHE